MIYAYDKTYLECAQASMGIMLDTAVNELHINLEEFYNKFLNSTLSILFSEGDPTVLAGKSGLELMFNVLEKPAENIEMPFNKSSEYWTGWALAYYQWYSGLSFQMLNKEVTIASIHDMYNPYHEMDISNFVNKMDELRKCNRLYSYLKLFRKRMGLTQKELAEKTDIPIKTIQQYEQRQKDINKAQAEYVIRLSKALCC